MSAQRSRCCWWWGMAVVLALIFVAGCASSPSSSPPPAPSRLGAINAFDIRAYDTLLVAQAAIEQAKAQASTKAEVLAVNAVVASYNLAYSAYESWRAAARAAGGAPPDAATLDAQIAAVVADVAEVVKAITDSHGGT